MTCSVCYQSMKDLGKALTNEETKAGEQISVANQCLSCGNILCHDCLVDWAVATINNLHVPDNWNDVDLLKLKCSSQKCEEIFSVSKLMQILDQMRFEKVSFSLSRRVMQSAEQFIACPNPECNSFSFY